MSDILIKGIEMWKCCAECPGGTYEYNDNDERCFVCGFIKSQHPWECEHVEIDGIDTTKARADFCPLIEVPDSVIAIKCFDHCDFDGI